MYYQCKARITCKAQISPPGIFLFPTPTVLHPRKCPSGPFV